MNVSPDNPDFIGVQALEAEQSEQLATFEEWAHNHDWRSFHSNHYDWWMFPIDAPSQFGFKYTVYATEISALSTLPGFLQRHARGAELLLMSWGFDANNLSRIVSPEPDQAWANWPIRWFKCTRSMQLFGQSEMYSACLAYGKELMAAGTSFHYNGRDLASEVFDSPDH